MSSLWERALIQNDHAFVGRPFPPAGSATVPHHLFILRVEWRIVTFNRIEEITPNSRWETREFAERGSASKALVMVQNRTYYYIRKVRRGESWATYLQIRRNQLTSSFFSASILKFASSVIRDFTKPRMIPANEYSAGSGCPVHILPIELLGRIFQVGTQDWAVSSVAASVLPFPVLICGVCKHCREVALNYPDLWSTIHILVRSSTTDIPHAWVQTFIDRAKSVPFTIIIDIPSQPPIKGLPPATLLSTMIKHPIRRLDIRSRNGENHLHVREWMHILQASNRTAYEQISLCFPNHRRGRVRFTKDENLLREEWGYELSADSLKRFRVSKLRVWGLCVYPPQFPNLTSLTAWEVEATPLELRDLLAESPSLTTLVLCRLRVCPISSSPEVDSTITLPSLRRLGVSFLRSNSSEIYPICYLRLPNLSHLEINGNSNVSLASAFKGSLSSADQLHTLKLFNFPHGTFKRQPRIGTNVDGVQDELDDISFLRSFTSVRHLHLIDSAAALLTSSPGAPLRRRRPSIGLAQRPKPSRAGMFAELRQGTVQLQSMNINGTKLGSNPPLIPFPDLQTITLVTLAADDLVDLCHYVGARKEKVEAVYLSTAAQRHLSYTLVRTPGEDTFRVPLPFTRPRKRDVGGVDQAKDADDWLRKRVEVHKFDPASRNDLLEDTTDQDPPLGEMM